MKKEGGSWDVVQQRENNTKLDFPGGNMPVLVNMHDVSCVLIEFRCLS